MMEKVYARTKGIRDDMVVGFCPGCMHGTVFKLIGEVLEELGVLEKTITVHGVGCCGLAMEYVTYDCTTSPHGRACAVATGVKRANPDKIVFTYQGDGDLASIGLAETLSAANRGENFTVIFVNNGIYGMTGGQMSPCTLEGAKTATTPYGRRHDLNGFPLKVSNVVSLLDGTCYVTRQAVHTPAAVRKAKAALKKAFQNALDKKGTSFVEVVATCSSGWKMSPEKSNKWMVDNMFAHYPLGDIKDTSKDAAEPQK